MAIEYDAIKINASFQPDSHLVGDLSGIVAYINAGGRGTRIAPLFTPHLLTGVSKALLEIGQPPSTLIDHQVNKLLEAGVETVVAGVGDHHNVAEYLERRYGTNNRVVALAYETQLGNGGDFVRAVRDYHDRFKDHVYILNVDTLLDIDEADFAGFHNRHQASLTIALTRNRGVPNEDAYFVSSNNQVLYSTEFTHNALPLEKATSLSKYRGSSTGALIVEKDIIAQMPWAPTDGPLSLYKDVMAVAVAKGGVFAYDNGYRLFTDIGTPDSWQKVQQQMPVWQKFIRYNK